jgi:hypothetical protein
MHEGVPQSEAVPSAQEKEPVSYEQVLQAAHAMKVAGVKDPFTPSESGDNTWAMLRQYEEEHDITADRIETIERARELVRVARIWLDAGYVNPDFRRRALQIMNTAYETATKESGDMSDTAVYLAGEIYNVKNNTKASRTLEAPNVRELFSGMVQKAKELAAAGNLQEAVDILAKAKQDYRRKTITVMEETAVDDLYRDLKSKLDAQQQVK